MVFSERLHERVLERGSRVCLGIDPRPERSPLTDPAELGGDAQRVADAVVAYFGAILRASADALACCKPQTAFFEALGLPGLRALAQLIGVARSLDLPVIVDAKRGDIGITAVAYAQAYLRPGELAGDALTVNPYLGMEALEPFLDAAAGTGRGVFVLVKTSSPGGADLQDLRLADGRLLYEAVADRLAQRAERLQPDARGYTPLGAVVGATHPEALTRLRRRLPRSVLLVPGYGAQGAGAGEIVGAFDGEGLGAVVNASRSLTYPPARDLDELARAASDAAQAMRDAINAALAARPRGPRSVRASSCS